MVEFEDYLENTDRNNFIIQNTLREIDFDVLATALVGVSQDIRDMFFRNLSKRAFRLFKDDLQVKEANAARLKTGEAQEIVKQLLRKHAKHAKAEIKAPAKGALPKVDLATEEATIETFKSLSAYLREFGFLGLEGIEDTIDHPIMKKGMELIIDGWEPLLIQSLLEKRRKQYLKDIENRLDMILEGLDSLASKDMPLLIEEKLRAYLQKS